MSGLQKLSATKLALLGRKTWSEQGALRSAEPIAIIGMGCRLPGGVTDPESLWELLLDGRDAVGEVPEDRWSLDEWFDPDPATPGRIATRWGGFLDDVRGFDAAFFDISPREAERMDPQQRLALEVACEAVEYAGIPLHSLKGTDSGVFFASYHNDYTLLQYSDLDGVGARTLTGALHSIVANRISYVLGLHGPSLAIDSACSSSLVATHLACQALRSRDCDLAIAGGVNVMISPHVTVALSKGGFMSPTGRCRTFDAAADGFVRSEGCAAVVLKRLADAVADGDPILAVIRGSAVNQDGESTNLAAPNGRAQEALVRQALKNAGVGADEISLLEAHGTGTQLGDPIETDALSAVFRGRPAELGPCYLGALKANLGHCEAAAGVASLIKTVLCLRHGTVPPHVHFRELSPHIDFEATPFRIVDRATPWTPPGGTRLAGVSSFGVGGTNAHVIVEEAPPGLVPAVDSPEPPFVLPLSARSAESLRGLCVAYADRLREQPETTGLIARAAARRRTHHREFRVAPVAASAEGLVSHLEAYAAGTTPAAEPAAESPDLCFVFSGQGTQWAGMGLSLLEHVPVFRDTLHRIDDAWQSLGGPSLLEELRRPADESRLGRTDIAQVGIFAVQVGLAEVLAGWRIRPAMVIGHSVGELAAAYASGMLSLDEALRAVSERGKFMQSTYDSGRMISVRTTEGEIKRHIAELGLQLSVAAINSPSSVVLSGAVDQVEAAAERLTTDGIEVRRLEVRFGFHSHLMRDAARGLGDELRELAGAAGPIPLVSTVTGRELDRLDGRYLATGIESPVRFAAAVNHALSAGIRHFVELAPHPALGRSILEVAEARGEKVGVVFAMHRERDAMLTIRSLAARVFEWGGEPAWESIDHGPCPPVPLPRYPWTHRPYWLPRNDRPAQRPIHGRPVDGAIGFPGRRITSPAVSKPVFELDLADPLFDALRDHRIGDRSRLPATALLELIRTAAEEAGFSGAEVRDLGIQHPVELQDVPGGAVQVVLEPDGSKGAHAEVYRKTGDATWQRVATGTIAQPTAREEAPLRDPESKGRMLSPEEFYSVLERDGCAFGPGFRLLDGVEASGQAASGSLTTARAVAWPGSVHPAVVDACAQLCVAVLEHREAERRPGAFLPWAVDRYVVFDPTGTAAMGRVLLREADAEGASFDVDVLDESGHVLVRIEGWRLRRALISVAPLRHIVWVPEDIGNVDVNPPATQVEAGRWLVLLDRGGLGERVAQALEQAGREVVREPYPTTRAEAESPRSLEDGPWEGVVHATGLDSDADGSDVAEAIDRSCRQLLAVGQAFAGTAERDVRLLVLTRESQSAGDVPLPSLPIGGAVWGLARAIRAEVPTLRCTSLDLDAPGVASETGDGVEWAVREALSAQADAEVAIRDGVRLVARLAPEQFDEVAPPPIGPYSLVHEVPGTLDGFALREASPARPGPGEVMVEVLAAGLNFRDVLTALGTYPGEARMGHECCGRVVALGEGVNSLSVGDRVMVFWPGCFGSHVTAPAAFVFPAPTGLTPATAATVPVVFGTAYHALHRVGGVREGMRVLVHSGAGGVGMAAIQLARLAGAEVFATAGSPEKREVLERLGVAAAFDSRSTTFESHVMAATEGEGVDIVINSLIGELIPAGLRCLRRGGVFVELGKREILSTEQVETIRPDVRYVAFDLRDEAEADPKLLPVIFAELTRLFERGALTPLPVRVVRMSDAASAFRRMARAEHIGKIVLVPSGAPEVLQRDGWIVVTGGSGALGLTTAEWLVERGGRKLALIGRSEPRPEAAATIDELQRRHGVEIRVMHVDVADADRLSSALDALRRTGTPITGVVHSAGVIDDALLPQLTGSRLAAVLAPKVAGAWNLHRATMNDPVALFLLYSAAGPVLNAAGQANYAAANGFLDALARYRRGLGLPASSVLWGPWAGMGMAEGLTEVQRHRWRRMGLDSWTPKTAAAVLDQLLGPVPEQVLALRLDAQAADRPGTATANGAPAGGPRAEGAAALVARWEELPPHRRGPALQDHVRGCVTTVLGREEPVDTDTPLRDLGLDSLSAIEVRNALTVTLGLSLPATLAFDHPTVDAITHLLMQRLGYATPESVNEIPAPEVREADHIGVATIDSLSDEEAELLLLEELQEDGDTLAPRGEPR